MNAKRAIRVAYRRLAAREMGLPYGARRQTASQLDLSGRETQAMRLPVLPNEQLVTDPVSGDLVYTVDFDPLDGAPLG